MGIARSTYYDKPATSIDNTALVETMAVISDCFEAYGYRRMQAALRHRGFVVNHKKIRRLMREHGLQPRRRRRYVATTDGDHELPIFPNLAKDIVPDGPNQLWVADITYVAIAAGFVYVAVILDAWSRKVVGFAIGPSIDVRLTLAALRSAIEKRKPPPGCVHHTDRGSQGGFNRSSQRPFGGGCDEEAEASIRSCRKSSVAFTGAPSGGRARRTKSFLGSHCRGVIERGGCGCRRYSTGSRRTMVPEGGRHGASDVQALGQAAVGPISVPSRARGYRTHAGPGQLDTGDRASARAIGVDDLPRAAPQRRHA